MFSDNFRSKECSAAELYTPIQTTFQTTFELHSLLDLSKSTVQDPAGTFDEQRTKIVFFATSLLSSSSLELSGTKVYES